MGGINRRNYGSEVLQITCLLNILPWHRAPCCLTPEDEERGSEEEEHHVSTEELLQLVSPCLSTIDSVKVEDKNVLINAIEFIQAHLRHILI